MHKLIGFLPLRIGGGTDNRDYENNLWRTNYLFKSLETQFQGNLEIVITSPKDEIAEIKSAISSFSNLLLTYVDQETILEGITELDAKGWHKQQILCLQFASSQPNHIIKFDPDMFLLKSLSEDQLWKNGKSATDWFLKPKSFDLLYTSSAIMHTEINWDLPVMNDTPFCMSPSVCKYLIDHLANLGLSLFELTTKHSWTEVILYTIAAELMNENGIQDYHFHCALHGSILKHKHRMSRFKIDPSEGYFCTIQGFLGLSERDTMRMISTQSI